MRSVPINSPWRNHNPEGPFRYDGPMPGPAFNTELWSKEIMQRYTKSLVLTELLKSNSQP